jgi:hypothetical protein
MHHCKFFIGICTSLPAGTEQLSVERYFTSTGALTYAYWIGLEWKLNRQ